MVISTCASLYRHSNNVVVIITVKLGSLMIVHKMLSCVGHISVQDSD
jgi:hypothetical protein